MVQKIKDFFNKDKRVEKYLRENGFTKVPSGWPKEMQSIGDKYDESIKTIRVLGEEYNQLLKDYANKLTGPEIKEILEEMGIADLPKGKAALQEKYFKVFEVEFDYTEEKIEK